MPSFTFKGFTTGSSVALSAAQGGSVASDSVASWGQNALSASLNILKIEPAITTAPVAVWFEAIELSGFDVTEFETSNQSVYDPTFDGITYVWTVEPVVEPGNPTLSYGVPKLVPGWDDARVAYGKKVAFFFPDPDTQYTVRCWAVDSKGNQGESTTTVTTQNADDVYQGAGTICLDPSGSFAGAPAGAQQVTSVSAMQSAIWGANGPRRVMIARGQDISDFALNENGGGDVRYVGAFGNGQRPILRSGTTGTMFDFYQTGAPQLTIEGLDCRGLWDAQTETGLPLSPWRAFQSSLLNLSMWDCRFDGFVTLNPTLNGSSAYVMAIGKTEITNWQSYGIYGATNPNARLAFIGCDVAQHIDAINHSQTERNGMVNQQGPARIVGYNTLYIGASSFMSRGGWSNGTDQPCLRLNSGMIEGAQSIIDRTTCEGGSVVIRMTGTNSSTVEKPGNHLFDKVLLLAGGGKTGREIMTADMGGTTCRNVLFVMLDAPNFANLSFSNCLSLTPDQTDSDNLTSPVKIYNCTSLNTRSAVNDFGDNPHFSGAISFTDYTEENSVVHAPGLDSPVTANTVTTNGPSAFSPRYRGIKPNFELEQGTLGGSVGTNGSFTLPYPSGTNQAYWQAIEATDTLHMMQMGDDNLYAAFDNSFSVQYESNQVRITNTSGSTWSGGTSWKLRLDRKSQIPAIDTTFGNPSSLVFPVPVLGSAIAPDTAPSAGTGLWAYDDFEGRTRPIPNPGGKLDHRNTPYPTTRRAQGALQLPNAP